MSRRIIFTILGAILLAIFVGLIWFWFFRGGTTPAPAGGTFGSGQDKNAGTSAGGGTQGGVARVQGGESGANTSQGGIRGIQSGGAGVGGSVGAGSGVAAGGTTGTVGSVGNGEFGSTGGIPGVETVPGVDWTGEGAGGTGGSVGGGPTTSFAPKDINQLNGGNVGGTPGIIGSFGGPSGTSGSGVGIAVGGIFGSAAGCAILFATAEGPANADAAARGATALGGGFVLTYDFQAYKQRSQNQFKDVSDCLTRTIAKAVLQQMTASIVNWINSGFNGQPSFVTNYQQFFSNVGDQAAGEFIKGTALSFLCSPFGPQIRIALAQSYARRNAPSCTLTGVVKNLNGFMNGNFAAGGWAGLLQFTTIPTNNPFGAYMYAQGGLATAQQTALNNANRNVSPGGFIGLQKEANCRLAPLPPGAQGPQQRICDKQIATPGSIIESSLSTTLGTSFRQLELAKSFDEIIGALITQLMTKTLQNGLSSLSGTQGYAGNFLTPEQQQAQADAEALLTDMQGRVQLSQQYGASMQGSISDLQGVQQRLQDLANCWESASSTPDLPAAKAAQAAGKAAAALSALHSYDAQVDLYNANILKANQSIVMLQDLETRTIGVTSAADVAAVKSSYAGALASGFVISQADVTQAQQDRGALQATLTSRNAATAADLQACHDF